MADVFYGGPCPNNNVPRQNICYLSLDESCLPQRFFLKIGDNSDVSKIHAGKINVGD